MPRRRREVRPRFSQAAHTFGRPGGYRLTRGPGGGKFVRLLSVGCVLSGIAQVTVGRLREGTRGLWAVRI